MKIRFFIVIIFFNIMREVILIFILVSIAQLFYGQEKYTIQGELPDHSVDFSCLRVITSSARCDETARM